MFLGRFPTFRNKKNRVGTSASRPAPTLQQQKLPIAVVVFAQIPAIGSFLAHNHRRHTAARTTPLPKQKTPAVLGTAGVSGGECGI